MQQKFSTTNANILKFQNNENIVHPHTTVPYTIMEKYFVITNTSITKHQCNALKPVSA
jgi:hypothetical protein